ncbi:MAG: hypothetical protein KF893_01345 [Caldilineaceae bacterium]|nr:hypothetical protein [Caldilineaceae bacterium]
MSLEFLGQGLKEDEILDLQDGKFEIHCLEMILEQHTSDQPKIYTGPGLIRQNSDGELVFSLYAKESIDILFVLKSLGGGVPAGKIIPDERYYRLNAIDSKQRRWESKRVLPNTTSNGRPGTICTGNISELSLVCEGLPAELLFLRFLETFQLPYNALTTTEIEIADKTDRRSARNVLHFLAVGHEFYLREDHNTLLVQVKSEQSKFSKSIEDRITETLQFMLARPLAWTIMTKYTEGKKMVSIRKHRSDVLRPRCQPPVSTQIGEDAPFCTLFEKYFQYVISYPEEGKIHPISAHMRAICRASTGSINAEALTICTAIESLLKEMPEATHELTDEEKEWIGEVRNFIRSGPTTLSKVKIRLEGTLGLLSNPVPRAALKALESKEVVTKNQVKSWNNLRNEVAHGDTLARHTLQELLNLCDDVLTLFYRLVFYRIGYSGKFIDYSESGWPTKEFTVSSSQDPQ